ncbi:MAG: MATE family efflux transporter [Oscillospiraceae bacterium]|nr:MATE family efflux transporter [Oscillospiraceae bacterium]
MSGKTMINDLTEGKVSKRLLKFAVPFILANLLQTCYNLVDMIVVGRFCGQAGLSAVSVGGDLLNIFVFLSVGMCSAGQIIISQYVGKKEYSNLNRAIGTFTTLMMGLAVVCTIIGLLCKNLFLDWMNVPQEAYKQAYEYTVVSYAGLIFVFGYNIVSSVLRGMGNSKTPLIFVGIATVVNLILDYILVKYFNAGAMGAAAATVFGQGVAFVSAVCYLYKRRESFGFDFKLTSFIPDKKILKILVRLGVPMSLQTCAINLTGLVVNSFINDYGLVASAVTGVGNKINSLATIVTTGVHTAGASMVGQNYAAGKQKRVVKIMGTVALYSCAFALVLSVIMVFFPEQVFAIFDNSPETVAMAGTYTVVAVISFFGFATRAPFLSLINGQGFAGLSLFMGIADSVVARIGLSILLGKVFGMGVMGFWLGNVLAGYVYTLIGSIYFISGSWKKRPLAVK